MPHKDATLVHTTTLPASEESRTSSPESVVAVKSWSEPAGGERARLDIVTWEGAKERSEPIRKMQG